MRFHDVFDFDKMKEDPEGTCVELCTVDAGIRAFDVSPEEDYIVVGTERGTVYVYETQNLLKNKAYIYARFQIHKNWIRGFSFLKSGNNLLLVTFCQGGHLSVVCMNEKIPLYWNDTIPDGIRNVIYNERCRSLMLVSQTDKLYQISLNFNKHYFKNLEQEINNDLNQNITKFFL